MNVQSTLNFYGQTEEAVKFYSRTIEAETVFMMRFRDRPDRAQLKPGTEEKIFHATFRIGSTEIIGVGLRLREFANPNNICRLLTSSPG